MWTFYRRRIVTVICYDEDDDDDEQMNERTDGWTGEWDGTREGQNISGRWEVDFVNSSRFLQ